jgi:hypothetical protein
MLKKWCDKIWLYVLYALGITITLTLIFNWSKWQWDQRLLTIAAVILPLHVLEEWQIPAGFHYQYNLVNGSDILDRYPMNRLTDMITNFFGELLFLGLIIYGANTGMIIAITVFCALEAIIHTIFGVKVYKKFKSKGKKTLYGPGSITAYLGFGVLGIMSFYYLTFQKIGSGDFIIGVVMLAVMLIGMILIPENLLKSKDTKFVFPSAGYFKKFL